MSAVVTRATCRTLLHPTYKSTVANRLVVRVPRHANILTRRQLHATASSSSSAPPTDAESTIPHEDITPDVGAGTEENMLKHLGSADEACNFAIDPFSPKSLIRRVHPATLKALIKPPIKIETITRIQAHVTTLLPDLVRPWDPEEIVTPTIPDTLPPDGKPSVVDSNASRDLLARAQTGTGKTLAFLIPAVESRLQHIQHNMKLAVIKAGVDSSTQFEERAKRAYRRSTAGSLVLAPTRELALQIVNAAMNLTAYHKGFEVIALVGVGRKSRQAEIWQRSSKDLVVATPGRLRSLLEEGTEFREAFKNCPLLILDEADSMLYKGFRDDIDAIISFLPRTPVRQTFLFSASLQRSVRQLAAHIIRPNSVFIDVEPQKTTKLVKSSDSGFTTHNHIAQFQTVCPTAADQLPTLVKLLVHDQLVHGMNSKVMVFCPTVQMTELVSSLLRMLVEDVVSNWSATILSMHSKMTQSEREKTREVFHKAGRQRVGPQTIFVTSDVSARGMDYPGVTRVIQICVPSKEELYVHRVGRMARGNQSAPTEEEAKKFKLRADMVLLPWEAGYMDWKLTNIPIQPLSVSEIDEQLASLSPQSPMMTTEFLNAALADIRDHVQPADIRATAASLVGFYLPLSPSFRLDPDAVVAGVTSWASECFNVSLPRIKRLPKRFTEAYESSRMEKNQGLYVDGVELKRPTLGSAKSRNRSVWEGSNEREKRPKRWY